MDSLDKTKRSDKQADGCPEVTILPPNQDRNRDFDSMMESQEIWDQPTQFKNLRLEDRRALMPTLDNWISHLEDIESASE